MAAAAHDQLGAVVLAGFDVPQDLVELGLANLRSLKCV